MRYALIGRRMSTCAGMRRRFHANEALERTDGHQCRFRCLRRNKRPLICVPPWQRATSRTIGVRILSLTVAAAGCWASSSGTRRSGPRAVSTAPFDQQAKYQYPYQHGPLLVTDFVYYREFGAQPCRVTPPPNICCSTRLGVLEVYAATNWIMPSLRPRYCTLVGNRLY